MTEDQFHRSVAQYLAAQLRPPTIWTTIPAGGGGRIRGAQLKGKGLQPGWPDIIVIKPGRVRDGSSSVVGLELKAKSGRASVAQKAVAKQFWDAGARMAFCRSIDDVKAVLKEEGFI